MAPSSVRNVSDASTIISILPVGLSEKKPGLIPGEYIIPAVKDPSKEVEVLVVGRARFPIYIDENRPALIVPEPSDRVAEAICRDFRIAVQGFNAGVAEPGLFWVPGALTKEMATGTLIKELEEVRALQVEWFKVLIAQADDDWNRYHSRKMISGLQKIASRCLGLDREWNLDIEVNEAKSLACKFCKTMVHPDAIICPACRGILNMEKFKTEFKPATTA